MLHPYLPITATSLQRPLSSVPKVVAVERFDYSQSILICLGCLLRDALISVSLEQEVSVDPTEHLWRACVAMQKLHIIMIIDITAYGCT